MESQTVRKLRGLKELSLDLSVFFQATLEGDRSGAKGAYLRVHKSDLWLTEKVYGKTLEKRLSKSLTLLDQQLDCAKQQANQRLKALSVNQVDSIIDSMALFAALVQKIHGLKSGREATEYIKAHYQEFATSVIIKEDETFSTEMSG